MRIAFASDHAGYSLKNTLLSHVSDAGYEVLDLGTNSDDSVDWPDYGASIGLSVSNGEADLGIAVCGSGIGICIAANKINGARAATVSDVTGARMTRLHNDANIMCVGERFIGVQVAIDAVDVFLTTEFEGGRHARRVDKLASIENQQSCEKE